MGGRPPTPTALKLLNGNPGKRPLPTREAKPKVGLPNCPSYLSEEAKKEWKRTGAKLAQLGLMTQIDETAFAAYCESRARWIHALEQLRKFGDLVPVHATTTTYPDGRVVKKSGRAAISPYHRICREAHEEMITLLREFGMTAASRSRVHAQQEQPTNKLAEYLRSA